MDIQTLEAIMNCTRISAVALTIPFIMTAAAVAAPGDNDQAAWDEWSKMREKAVHATDILAGDVSNRFSFVGNVTDLILSEDGRQIQYILYNVPYPYNLYDNANHGYVIFDTVRLERGYGAGIDVEFDEDQAARPPEEIEVTRDEADHRMVSRLIEGSVYFSESEARDIEDMLINPSTGAVTHFIIQMDQETVFGEESRAISVNQISVDEQGRVTTGVGVDEIDDLQEFDTDFL